VSSGQRRRNSGEESVKPENWGGAVLMFWGNSGGDSTNKKGGCSRGDESGAIDDLSSCFALIVHPQRVTAAESGID
jgi:hypothetical protein